MNDDLKLVPLETKIKISEDTKILCCAKYWPSLPATASTGSSIFNLTTHHDVKLKQAPATIPTMHAPQGLYTSQPPQMATCKGTSDKLVNITLQSALQIYIFTNTKHAALYI